MPDPSNTPTASFSQTLEAMATRLSLDDTGMAAYLGVPVHTYRKWISGARQPGAAVHRLIYIMGTMEALAPSLHESFVPVRHAHVEKVKTDMEVQS